MTNLTPNDAVAEAPGGASAARAEDRATEARPLRTVSPVTAIVAIGIGAALFFVVGKFLAIPLPIPNTTLNLRYAVLLVFAVLFGPWVGALVGLIGHTLIDLTTYGPWWSWIAASAVVGLVIGLATRRVKVDEGVFGWRGFAAVAIGALAGHLVAWVLVAPLGDILIYAEPANKVFVQGAVAFGVNSLTSIVLGGALVAAYAATRTRSGSLRAE